MGAPEREEAKAAGIYQHPTTADMVKAGVAGAAP
jgi:hypothetical protein